MVVCRFFLGGNCRYGDKCWNEHPSGGNQGYQTTAQRQLFGGGRKTNNQYQWRASDSQQAAPSAASTSSNNQLSPADIVRALSAEITSMWEAGKMWPFSCMGFEKDMPSLPGLTDISMEEMRHEAYDALKQGNIQPYVQKVECTLNEVLAKRQELKNPGMSSKQTLIVFIDDCRRKQASSSSGQVSLFSDSSGGGLFGSGKEGSGLFGQNPASSQAPGPFGASSSSIGGVGSSFGAGSSPFGAGSSTFGSFGAAGNGGGQTAFGQAAAPPSGLFGATGSGLQPSLPPPAFGQAESQSLFGKTDQSSQPAFGQSAFGQTQNTTSAGLFGKAGTETPQAPTNSLFGKPVGSPFGGNAFGSTQTATTQQSANPFGSANLGQSSGFGSTQPLPAPSGFGASSQPSSTVGGAAPVTAAATSGATGQAMVDSLYTPIEQLTDEEKQQFAAQTFTVGMIPTKPPPKEMCF
ncbi:nucleoporin NUP42-like [Mya arenaria]|uniref:nucleoporin NUP42-like n=1 Tax=Mya arenaria TaxID=6604 RepID=UPI0022E83742|nr:nucleoporin NUP42-like [Mya arenaria]